MLVPMYPSRLTLSKRDEKAKRLNAKEGNLLQMEVERFEKQHNKEMKNILLERQIAKETMSDIRRQRTSSLLAARAVLQENDVSNNNNNTISSPTLAAKRNSEIKASLPLSLISQSSEAQEDVAHIRKPHLPHFIQRSPHIERKISEDVAVNLSPSTGRKRAQTFSGTTVCGSEWEISSRSPIRKSPNLGRKSSEISHAAIICKPEQQSSSASLTLTPTLRRKIKKDVATSWSPIIGTRKRAQTISGRTAIIQSDVENMKILEYIPVCREHLSHSDQDEDLTDGRSRSLSDGSSDFKSKQTSLKMESVRNSPCLSARSSSRSPLAERRMVSVDDVGRLLLRQNSLDVPYKSPTQQRWKLSPSTGIAKFRKDGAAAFAVQTLISNHHREKSILAATEKLITEREKREMTCKEEQQKNVDPSGKNCPKRTTGLRQRLYTIAQLVIALNSLKLTATRRRRRFSFTKENPK